MCAARLEGRSNSNDDLLHQARVSLALGNDTAAKLARTKYLAAISQESHEQRAWGNLLIIQDDTAARPVRFDDALDALARMEQLPSRTTFLAQLEGNIAIAAAAQEQWRDSLSRTKSNRAIEIWRSLDERMQPLYQNYAEAGFLIKIEQALRLGSMESARAIIDSARKAIPQGTFVFEAEMAKYTGPLGKPALPIEAQHWFRRGDTLARPLRGKVTIVGYEKHNGCEAFCGTLFDLLNRLQSQFGQDGLDILLVTRTRGFARDTAPVTPLDEARNDSTEILGGRKVPGILAVIETEYHWNVEGRRINHPNKFETDFPLSEFVLIDRNGTVRYLSREFKPWMEGPLTDLIKRMLAERDS